MGKKINNNGLTDAEISKFKTLLLAKRSEILGDVFSMEDDTFRRQNSTSSNISTKIDDAGSDNYEMENTLGLMDSERKILRQVDEALERIEDGTYGICQGNGKKIPKARLEAIPWTKYCVEYASMLEKGLINTQSRSNAGYDYGDDEKDDNLNEVFQRTAK